MSRYLREKRKNLRKRYGITLDDFMGMWERQNGACRICRVETQDSLCVDHCHISGRIRGLLCHACNVMLARAGDNILILRAAIDYLNEKL